MGPWKQNLIGIKSIKPKAFRMKQSYAAMIPDM